MTQVNLSGIVGKNPPYTIYVCNVYGNYCSLLGIIGINVPPSLTFTLPLPYQFAPAVGIKIITSDGCERFEILDCSSLFIPKQFQDNVDFYFQDNVEYEFPN